MKLQAKAVRCNWVQVVYLICFLTVPSLISAQEVDDVIRVDTELVVLNITVTEKSGEYVPGLKLSDFKIYENGKEVQPKLISSFSVQESPFASVVLLDTSGSMEGRMSLLRSAAIRFLDGLRPEDVAAVFKFDQKVEPVQEFSSGRDLAPTAYGLRARGMTTMNDAIIQAADALAERTEARKAIIVLSDGVDTYSRASAGKALERALAVGATIYTVDMSARDSRGPRNLQNVATLKNLAEKSGGRFVATPGGPGLREAFAGIAEELGHQYTIAYRPLNPAKDGKWRTLEVKVSRDDLVVRTRKGYHALRR